MMALRTDLGHLTLFISNEKKRLNFTNHLKFLLVTTTVASSDGHNRGGRGASSSVDGGCDRRCQQQHPRREGSGSRDWRQGHRHQKQRQGQSKEEPHVFHWSSVFFHDSAWLSGPVFICLHLLASSNKSSHWFAPPSLSEFTKISFFCCCQLPIMIQPTPVKTQSGNLSPVLQRGSSSSSRWEEYSRAATGDRVALALVSTSTSLPDDQDGHPRPLPTTHHLSRWQPAHHLDEAIYPPELCGKVSKNWAQNEPP